MLSLLLKIFLGRGGGGQGDQGQISLLIEKMESHINNNNKNMGLVFGHKLLRVKVLYVLERAAISI